MLEHVINVDLIREASRDESLTQLDPEGSATAMLKSIFSLMGPALGESTMPFPELVVRVAEAGDKFSDDDISYRSAETGRYVTEANAEANPATTVREES